MKDTEALLLKDLKAWMNRHLQDTRPRNDAWSDRSNGFGVVEIPEWEIRQKLQAVEEALSDTVTNDSVL